MKRSLAIIIIIVFSITLIACGNKNTNDVKIDYGKSSLYTIDDMDKAIDLIKKEFNTWDGCKMHTISYAGDDFCTKENIDWMNDLNGKNKFTQCIAFKSNFHSPKKTSEGLEPDMEYTNFEWWLARSDNGSWKLMTWGY